MNQTIEGQLTKLPSKQWKMVRLEEISLEIPNIFSFLGVEESPVSVRHSNKAHYAVKNMIYGALRKRNHLLTYVGRIWIVGIINQKNDVYSVESL